MSGSSGKKQESYSTSQLTCVYAARTTKTTFYPRSRPLTLVRLSACIVQAMRADADAYRWWHDAGDADEDADAGHLSSSAAQESEPLMTSCLATDVSDGYSRYYLVSPLSTIKSVLLLAIQLSNFYNDAGDIYKKKYNTNSLLNACKISSSR